MERALTAVLPNLDPTSYAPHRLHDQTRVWPETNCYVDLWIELLAALGHEPAAALGFTVTQDFEGDQFTFFKFSPEDLDLLFGIGVQELAIYHRVETHVAEQIRRGRLPLVEADGYWLPDTQGLSYRTQHTKTTIAINRIDCDGRLLEYFHNGGYYRLVGADFDALFRRDAAALFPYVEFVKLGRRPPAGNPSLLAIDRLRFHLARRPAVNPLSAFQDRLEAAVERLGQSDGAAFHAYAFNTARQLGANFELLAAHLDWLQRCGGPRAGIAMAAAQRIAETAKAFQFQLARAVVRKQGQALMPVVARMAEDYGRLMLDLDQTFAGSCPAVPR